jgi:VCBS repeat-containing protein
VTEDSHTTTLTINGDLDIADADSGQSNFIARSNVVGSYGTFSIGTDGAWTYSANNNSNR